MTDRPRVGVSRCLLGDEVRYDGGHKREPLLIDALRDVVEWVPVCPEVEVGMGVPREPVHLVRESRGVHLRGVESGRDWTEPMKTWARQRIAELETLDLAGFVLKARSPSCGVRDVPLHGAGPPERGRGLFARILAELVPSLPVADEEDLRDPAARAWFIDRVRDYRTRRAGLRGTP
jgi:uncharacterized protein YbbK (DUF523 family)